MFFFRKKLVGTLFHCGNFHDDFFELGAHLCACAVEVVGDDGKAEPLTP